MLTSLHSPGPYPQNALQSFGHRRQYQGVRSLFCASSAATALLGSSTLRGCALPRPHDFLLLAPQIILSLFPILVTDSSSYLFLKKKKRQTEGKHLETCHCCKNQCREILFACWCIWFVLLSTFAISPSWYPYLLHFFFKKVPQFFCPCLEDGFLQDSFCIVGVTSLISSLTAFSELPNYIFFPQNSKQLFPQVTTSPSSCYDCWCASQSWHFIHMKIQWLGFNFSLAKGRAWKGLLPCPLQPFSCIHSGGDFTTKMSASK